ncbi:hypothetical protein L1987_62007 [Smallanthus sonchifolius]|uniref:Uncharacterized protein n=1 Tax=Smallanthus sonchifolius TaxID=185202 RepID=A0ACB9C977_9ASTR|nr:hypothetical protein L1987_62007 [Smallanthus sonchifolius]
MFLNLFRIWLLYFKITEESVPSIKVVIVGSSKVIDQIKAVIEKEGRSGQIVIRRANVDRSCCQPGESNRRKEIDPYFQAILHIRI